MRDQFQILAWLKSDELRASLSSALKDSEDLKVEVKVGDFESVAPQLVNGSAPNMLLVDLSLQDAIDTKQLTQIISKKQGDMAVIATAKEADLDTIRSLMRMGFADFIPQPFNEHDLVNAVAAVQAKISASARDGGGSVLSFLSASGGVGSTTLAIQTAADLLVGDKKQRNRVCLIDFDVQMGNVGLSLDMHSQVGLQTLIENPERLDDDFIASVVGHHDSGLDVMQAPSSILPLEIVTPELTDQVLSWARHHYDYVVTDMPLNWTSWTGAVLQKSDMIMMVTDVSVSGAQRCQRQFNLLSEQQLDDVPLAVIANRAKSGFGAGTASKQMEAALGRKINCYVRDDASTATAAREEGVLLRDIKRRSRIEKDLSKFLAKVRPALAVAKEKHEAITLAS